LNNPHSSRQIDSGSGKNQITKALNDGLSGNHFTKAPNTNDGSKERFTKALNDDLKKQAKSSDKTHYKNSDQIEKA
jgi:hypothetical protein